MKYTFKNCFLGRVELNPLTLIWKQAFIQKIAKFQLHFKGLTLSNSVAYKKMCILEYWKFKLLCAHLPLIIVLVLKPCLSR